jgi:hypothetical protein
MITKQKINLKIDWGTDAEEFKKFVGRYPRNAEELKSWAYAIKRGIDAQIDWAIVCDCASQEFER